MTLLLSIILAAIVAYILLNVLDDDISEEKLITTQRLKKIKNRVYDNDPNSKTENKKGFIKGMISDEEHKFANLIHILEKFNIIQKLKQILKVADIKADISQFLGIIIILFIFGIIIGIISPAKGSIIVVLIIGLGTAILPPFFYIKRRINKKLDKFTEQLPDALGLITSSLKAGHSLPSAFAIVVQELPDPIGGLFKLSCEDINLGRSTKEALDNMVENLPQSIDLKFFVTAVLIQREIGGNLAEILNNLNDTIRERFKLLGQLKSQTAQAKLSGIVLALAPVIIGGIIYLFNPEYMSPLFTHPLGKIAVGISIFMGITGYIIIKKITSIKV